MLHVEVSGSGPRLVVAHGFTQTARCWGAFGELLFPGREVVAADLPGHGGSSELRAGLADVGRLLLDAGGDEPFDLLGYSLGARVAIHAALGGPPTLRRLVLIGGTAGIEDPAARAARRSRDETLADELEGSGDVGAFLERWLAAPMFAGLRDTAFTERMRNTAAGLASSLRLAGAGAQEPLWEQLPEVACPVLALAGADDVRFGLAAGRIADGVAAGVMSLVPGAGHAAHLEQPRLAARIVEGFLA